MKIARELTEWLGKCWHEWENPTGGKDVCSKCGFERVEYDLQFVRPDANDVRLLTDKISGLGLLGEYHSFICAISPFAARAPLAFFLSNGAEENAAGIHRFLTAIPIASGGLAK